MTTTLPAPPRPLTVPDDAQWVAGETAGAWFTLVAESPSTGSGQAFRLTCYCADGPMDCPSVARATDPAFVLTSGHRLLPMAHCRQVVVEQGGTITRLVSW